MTHDNLEHLGLTSSPVTNNSLLPSLCQQCGTCCVAPDISSLKKPAGASCPHLDVEHRCTIYQDRPAVCRGYQPDELCQLITAPTLAERVKRYLAIFA